MHLEEFCHIPGRALFYRMTENRKLPHPFHSKRADIHLY